MCLFPKTREGRWRLVATALCAYLVGVPFVGLSAKLVAALVGWDNFDANGLGVRAALGAEEAERYALLGRWHLVCLVALPLILPMLTDKRVRRVALAIWVIGMVLWAGFIWPMAHVAKTK